MVFQHSIPVLHPLQFPLLTHYCNFAQFTYRIIAHHSTSKILFTYEPCQYLTSRRERKSRRVTKLSVSEEFLVVKLFLALRFSQPAAVVTYILTHFTHPSPKESRKKKNFCTCTLPLPLVFYHVSDYGIAHRAPIFKAPTLIPLPAHFLFYCL